MRSPLQSSVSRGTCSGYQRRHVGKLRLSNRLYLAIENRGKAHQYFRSARRTLPRTIANAIAVLAKIG